MAVSPTLSRASSSSASNGTGRSTFRASSKRADRVRPSPRAFPRNLLTPHLQSQFSVRSLLAFIFSLLTPLIAGSQSPWSLKPPPVLERTSAESLAALTRHFEKQIKLYGNQIVVNLAETSGKEAVVVQAYREGVQALGEDKVK